MFTKIMYINLDRRPDRKLNVMTQLKNINNTITVERINAIDATKLDIANLSEKLVTYDGVQAALDTTKGLYTILTKGAIGCAISHKIAWEKISLGNDERVLILEDDITFCDNYNEKLLKILDKIEPIKHDILFLGTHGYYKGIDEEHFDRPSKLYGLFGYILNKKAAIILLSIFPIKEQIDTEMAKVFSMLDVYTVKYNKDKNIDDRIILSDLSQEAVTFGTDIQHREYFDNIDSSYNSHHIILLLVFCSIVIYLYIKNKKPLLPSI